MTQYAGILGSVIYMTGGTTLVEELSEWSADFEAAELDTSKFGDTWGAAIVGLHNASGSFSGGWDGTATAQAALISSQLGGSIVALRLYITDAKYFSGNAVLTGMSPSTSIDGKAELSFDWSSNGAWTLT